MNGKLSAVTLFTLLAAISMVLTGCLLGDDIDTLRAKAKKGSGGTGTGTTYTVTFNANGGIGMSPASIRGSAGSEITLPNGSGLSRDGYTFGGWNTTAAGTGINYTAGDYYTVSGKDVTLYAKWDSGVTAAAYTVTFNANGGIGTVPGAQTVNPGSEITLPNEGDLSRDGYTFGGWNINAAGTGTNYSAGASYAVAGTVTLYAKWDSGIISYTITFSVNGGSGTAPAAQTVNAGSGITLPDESGLSRTGYTFGGWNTTAAGTGTNYSAGAFYTAAADITLYARWGTVYTVTSNSNGGSAVSSQAVTSGDTANQPTDPVRDGFYFDGWYSDSGLSSRYNFLTPVTGNITLYAKWTAIPQEKRMVMFDSNGGSHVPSQIIDTGGTASRPANPTRQYYTFDNWYTNSGLTAVYNFSTPVTGNITLYAKWNTVSHTVTFNSNGGGAVSSQSVNSGDTAARPANPARSGYIFDNWYTDSGLTAVYNFFTPVTGATTLYARWIRSYTVTFNVNSGSGTAPAAQTIGDGSGITLPDGSGLSRSGYTFGGWNTNAAGTGTNYSAGAAYTVTGDVTLYAKWNAVYTVTFNVNGGSGTAPTAQTASANSSVTLPNEGGLSRTGYTFGGWNTTAAGTGTNYSAGSSFTVTGTVTLYAKWDISIVTPSAPQTAPVVTVGNGQLTVSWTAVDGATAYEVWAGTSTNSASAAKRGGDVTELSSVITGLTNGTTYYVWIKAKNSAGTSGFSPVASGTPLVPVATPAAPQTAPAVTAGNGQLTVTWTAVDGATAYEVWAGTTTNSASATKRGGDVTTLTSTITGLTNGTTYYVWIKAKNSAGTSGFGPAASGTPLGQYTVTFDVNGGSGTAPTAQTANAGSSITLPGGSGLTRSGYTFGGWNTNTTGTGTNYSAGAAYTVTVNVTLYAKWDIVGGVVPGANLADKYAWLQTNAQSGGDYTIEVSANENIGPQTLSYSGKSNVTITLKGIGARRTLSLSSNGSLFTVGSGVTLVLDNNITLQGRANNSSSVVRVDNGGTLAMNTGAVITGNNTSSTPGGGVYVLSGGTFTMHGGEISGNTASLLAGGGVSVSGTFTMYGGSISGNAATGVSAHGGGVHVTSSGTFTMSGGSISGNTVSNTSAVDGGGVYVSGTFTMSGGSISGNTVTSTSAFAAGGGVLVSGTFAMSGGEISGNTATSASFSACGGGVYVVTSGGAGEIYTFTMSGGSISGNIVSGTSGTLVGGVYTSTQGGGVSVRGTFTKTAGTITGYGSDTVNGNVVKNSSGAVLSDSGHAVYVEGSIMKRKETTAGPTVNLSYNRTDKTFSGGWDN